MVAKEERAGFGRRVEKEASLKFSGWYRVKRNRMWQELKQVRGANRRVERLHVSEL